MFSVYVLDVHVHNILYYGFSVAMYMLVEYTVKSIWVVKCLTCFHLHIIVAMMHKN